jgi:hypothetical protein
MAEVHTKETAPVSFLQYPEEVLCTRGVKLCNS